MHYFTKRDDDSLIHIATCEDDACCARLEQRGYAECSVAERRAAWRDRVRRLELREEDERAMRAADQARIVGKQLGVVYPSMVEH